MALGDCWKQLSWFYYQYLLVTALYMLEPWERTVFNSLLISVAGMAVYTGYVFMPQHIMAILHYLRLSSDTRTLSIHPLVPSVSGLLSVHLPACLSLLGLRRGLFPTMLRQNVCLPSFKANSISKVKALNVVLEAKLDDVIPWDCFSLTRLKYLLILSSVGFGAKTLEVCF